MSSSHTIRAVKDGAHVFVDEINTLYRNITTATSLPQAASRFGVDQREKMSTHQHEARDGEGRHEHVREVCGAFNLVSLHSESFCHFCWSMICFEQSSFLNAQLPKGATTTAITCDVCREPISRPVTRYAAGGFMIHEKAPFQRNFSRTNNCKHVLKHYNS